MPPTESDESQEGEKIDRATGGIHARRRIDAQNVVSGVQIQGDPQEAAAWVSIAQNIRRGTISADEIKATNVVD